MSGAAQKTCFVIMGFGEKIDYQSSPQRTLDLDKTYEYIIEPAVRGARLACIRADKIIHSRVIDEPMYENLLSADVVIADLSTSNANAIYELGVRHALRPYTTIVMCESSFKFPFDLSHLSMLKYEHLGKAIDHKEVLRTRGLLKKMVVALADKAERDSPVYLCLPSLTRAIVQPASKASEGSSSSGDGVPPHGTGGPSAPASSDNSAVIGAAPSTESLADLLEKFRATKASAKKASDWIKVVVYLELVRELQPNDAYVAQQLALATYKSEQPERVVSLQRAKEILAPLSPEMSSDAETVGLWGAIHKRLWDVSRDRANLDRAIAAYERGFYLRHDYYTGINFAFLLDQRAVLSAGDEAIADRVWAQRCRRTVLAICEGLKTAGGSKDDDIFWVEATRIEALLGLGRGEESDAAKGILLASDPPPAPWMVETLDEQLAKLRTLLPPQA